MLLEEFYQPALLKENNKVLEDKLIFYTDFLQVSIVLILTLFDIIDISSVVMWLS